MYFLLDGTKLYSGRTQHESQQHAAYLGLDNKYDESSHVVL